ncbi:YqiJ family protein [Alteromonas sp. 1_MG-2023]|uniref:YqiJ family protein n=1 Tax=Alteromonas sp. 1_MG-2023 TaxID=3062669 RepID=UPI0026E373B6|nr:YqiJ family protein [Alteromonas sp. 1_MG-2023]MDO6567565.1 YqiJ family protein [Alteromonas sp. 1_MG-2023]
MLDVLLSDANFWFSIALATVAILFIIEIAGLVFGISLIGLLDDMPNSNIDIESSSILSLGSWLNLDRVPLLIWLVVFLTTFGLLGFAANFTTESIASFTLPVWVTLPFSALIGVLITSKVSLIIASIIPKFQTSAIHSDEFIGAVAHITIGTASKGNPAEAKFTDNYSQPHYVLVEPFEDDELFKQGEQVILVKKTTHSWLATRYQ